MKKKTILASTALISTFATAGFVAVIDADSGGDYKTIMNVNKKITCGIGEGVTRNQLDSMISNNEDITNVCTSNIQDFSYLFSEGLAERSISLLSSEEEWIPPPPPPEWEGEWNPSPPMEEEEWIPPPPPPGWEGEWNPSPPMEEGEWTPPFNGKEFNQDISKWDVSNGVNFEGVFYQAEMFNQDISNWDVSNGTNFERMFQDAFTFNQAIGNWDVSKGSSFSGMFQNAKTFNKNIGDWNVSNGINFTKMFLGSTLFNQPIGDWDISKATSLYSMFESATSFNKDISIWDVSNVIYFDKMFENAISFNKPIGNWNTSSGRDFKNLLKNATSFNQPIGGWDVSSGTKFKYMFSGATSFNQPIGGWDVSSGTEFRYMFSGATSFNQPINNWKTVNASDFSKMFSGATSFNQDIHLWDTKLAVSYFEFGKNSGLSLDNMPCKFGGNCLLDTDKDGYFDSYEIELGTDPLDAEDYPKIINHPSNTNTVMVIDGEFKYFDNGGLEGNYSDNVRTNIIFKPKNKGDLISITFNKVKTSSRYDYILIYDMHSTPIRLSRCYFTDCEGETFTASNADGELKVGFYSNNVYNSSGWEAIVKTITPPNIDTDNDGIIDAIDDDDDNDGFDDKIEILSGSDPLDVNDIPLDTDNDGVVNGIDSDDDNDGFQDSYEISLGTDPLDVNDFPKLIKHPTSGNVVQVVDGKYSYFDDGGADSDHSANINNTLLTFVPMNNGEMVTVTFEDFKTSSYRAELYIYSGDSTNSSNFLAKCEGTNCKGKTYKSASSDGKLTFKFHSGSSWQNDGWFAKISTTP